MLFVIPELTAELAAERMVQRVQSTETTSELDSRLERWVAATKATQRNSREPSAAQNTLLSNSQVDAFVPHTYDLIDQLSAWSQRLDQREVDLDQREHSLGRHSRFLRQCSIKQWNG